MTYPISTPFYSRKQTREALYDFSENNMKNKNGFDWDPCRGGNYEMATAYLTRWTVPDDVTWYTGPVAEADDPYDPAKTCPERLVPSGSVSG